MPFIKKEDLRSLVNLTAVIKGTFLTLVISLVLSIGIGVFYYFSSVTERSLPWFAALILAISVLIGSLTVGREVGNRGLYNGLAVGLIFFIIVWLVSGLIMPGQVLPGIIQKFLIVTFAGAFGGIIGVGRS